jgi:serine/threonine protein kinase
MVGQTFAHYRIVGKLGVGGMGVVYDAEDQNLGRRVALKFLADELVDDPDAKRRLAREAQTIALLNHPRICAVYEIDQHDGRAFIAMERLDGETLGARMAQQKLGTADIVSITLQVSEALEAAHAKGVVHRDIKPANIFVDRQLGVKVLDFGLARRVPVSEVSAFPAAVDSTIPGRPLGTVSYMAPERIRQLPLDPRCDLFSLGVILYQMATGRLPFAGASPAETVTRILDADPEPVTTVSPERPRQLGRIVRRLIAKRPEDRYQSATHLRADLQALQHQGPLELFRQIFRGRFPVRKIVF